MSQTDANFRKSIVEMYPSEPTLFDRVTHLKTDDERMVELSSILSKIGVNDIEPAQVPLTAELNGESKNQFGIILYPTDLSEISLKISDQRYVVQGFGIRDRIDSKVFLMKLEQGTYQIIVYKTRAYREHART